jgi:hypothetical protein
MKKPKLIKWTKSQARTGEMFFAALGFHGFSGYLMSYKTLVSALPLVFFLPTQVASVPASTHLHCHRKPTRYYTDSARRKGLHEQEPQTPPPSLVLVYPLEGMGWL